MENSNDSSSTAAGSGLRARRPDPETGKALVGQVAVITGGSRGIGLAYARRLASMGADVAIGDLAPGDEAQGLVEAEGVRFHFGALDVSDESSVEAFVDGVVQRLGRIDVLVNNAGIYPYESFDDMTYAAWRKVMSVNLDGPFLMCKAVVPIMRGFGYGRIVNVASAECWMNATRNLHYISSKMGVVGLTRALASEVAESGILVNAVAPGITDTATVRNEAPDYLVAIPASQAIHRAAEPEDIAATMAWLASPQNSFVTGQVMICDGGLVRI